MVQLLWAFIGVAPLCRDSKRMVRVCSPIVHMCVRSSVGMACSLVAHECGADGSCTHVAWLGCRWQGGRY